MDFCRHWQRKEYSVKWILERFFVLLLELIEDRLRTEQLNDSSPIIRGAFLVVVVESKDSSQLN
jgi:hypothetical protein